MHNHLRNAIGLTGLLVLAGPAFSAFTPVPIPFNDKGSHGPDGPWNYITLNVGDNPISTVDFYPMFGDHGSLLVTQSACSGPNNAPCISPVPNYYNEASGSATNASFDKTVSSISDNQWTSKGLLNLNGSGYWSTAQVHNPLSINDTLVWISNDMSQGLGNSSYIPVSLLSVEAVLTDKYAKLKNGSYAVQNTMLQSFNDLYNGPQAFGLHIGSTKYNQSGSLFFGGYDQNRLIETPAVFTSHGPVGLSGVGISSSRAASDGSVDPWANYSSKPPSNLLSSPLNSVTISPQVPNLLLPQSLCQNLGNYLPITYDNASNLYLWNTSSPLYQQLTQSYAPLFSLSFTFNDAASTSIRVPFALLDLTLSAPIRSTPTAYFPCEQRSDTVQLGRAFLQAALVSQIYNPDSLILGQAAGPSVNQAMAPATQNLSDASKVAPNAGAQSLEDSWAPFLTGFTPSGNDGSGSSTSGSAKPGLSRGGMIGIALGVTAAAALVIGVIIWDLRRRAPQDAGSSNAQEVQAPPAAYQYREDGVALQQFNGGWKPTRPPRPPSHLTRLYDDGEEIHVAMNPRLQSRMPGAI